MRRPQGNIPEIDNSGEATVVAAPEGVGVSQAESAQCESTPTRYASPEELAELRDLSKSMARQRRLAMLIAVAAAAIIVALAYYVSESKLENPVTWPGATSGNYDDGEFKIDLGNNGKFLIYYPNSPAMVKKSDGKNFEVLTAAGKNLDVPFHISFTSKQLEAGFKKTARESFEEWMAEAEKNGAMKFTSAPENDFFNKQDNGYPYIKIEYSRKLGKMSWRGVACYMRFLDKEILLMREVPASQYWRCSDLVDEYDCISIANSTVARHWEIPEKPLDEDPTKMLQMLNNELRKNIEIASWSDIDILIRSLFTKAYAANEKPLIDAAESMLEKFRAGQKIWYSRKCLEYLNAQREGNSAEMARILNDCLEKFEPLDDYRYTRIMKNDWSVE